MANEIKASVTLQVDRTNLRQTDQGSGSFDQAAVGGVSGIQAIGTTHEALAMGDVTSAGYAFLKNIDETDTIEIGIDASGTFHPFASLGPGEFGCVPLATNAPFAKASANTPNLYYRIWEA